VREAERNGDSKATEPAAPKQAPAGPPVAARVLALQQAAGNRAVAGVLARMGFWDRVEKFFTGDYTAEIGGEKVVVQNETQEKDAKRIIKDVLAKYGVEISSIKSLKAVQSRAKGAPEAMLKKLKTRPWLYIELAAVERALGHFSPVLGKGRGSSTRRGEEQELVSVGKLEDRLGVTDNKWAWKSTYMGEYFRESELRNFAMYKHGETATPDFPGNASKQMEATAVHEIAHGVFRYALADWVKKLDFWLDEDTPTKIAGAEAPPTSYGKTNAREDLSETVMLYFVDRKRLQNGNGAAKGDPGNPCPVRDAMIDALVKGWTPAPFRPSSEKGDFPVTDKTPETAVA
jgi:hypothetical protein